MSFGAFSWLNTSSSTESTFWAIHIWRVYNYWLGLQATAPVCSIFVNNLFKDDADQFLFGKSLTKFLTLVAVTFCPTQNLNYHLSFFAKIIVHYCLHNSWRVNDVNSRHPWSTVCTAGIQKTTVVKNSISSLTVHTFKPNFAHSFQINCNILDTNLP